MATWILEIIQLNKTIQANSNIATCLSLSPLPSSFLDLVKQRKLEQIRRNCLLAGVAKRDKVVFYPEFVRAQEHAISETLNSLIRIERSSMSVESNFALALVLLYFAL